MGSQVDRAHLLVDVVQNLELDFEYCKTRTFTMKVSVNDRLDVLIKEATTSL